MMKLNTNIVLCFAHVYQTSQRIIFWRIRHVWETYEYHNM